MKKPSLAHRARNHEGGIREPLIVRWPDVTKPDSVCDVPDINVDLFPTFLAAAGATTEKTLDGGREKLATNHAVKLYNLKYDIGERTDLATQNAAKRDELLNELLGWHQSIKAIVPTEPNPKYDPTEPLTSSKKRKGKKAE